MTERTLPVVKNNPVNATVAWFYRYVWGAPADASLYARHNNKKNPKALCHLMIANPELDCAVYTPEQVAMLVYYLEDSGVEVNDLGIVTIPGLLASYVNHKKSDAAKAELSRVIAFLKGENVAGKGKNGFENQFSAPSGWGG